MSKLRRYRVPVTGSGHTVIMQLDPDTAHQRYPNAVEVAVRAPGDTQTKVSTPAKRTRKAAPKDPAPKDPAPKDPAPKDPAPKDPAPKDPAPKDPAPKDPAPKDPAPKDPAPKDPAPKTPAEE